MPELCFCFFVTTALLWSQRCGVVRVLCRGVFHVPRMATLQHGDSPLHIAATHGDVDLLSLLFDELGAVVDALNNDGETVLHLAALFGHTSAVEYLAEKAPFLLRYGNKVSKR